MSVSVSSLSVVPGGAVARFAVEIGRRLGQHGSETWSKVFGPGQNYQVLSRISGSGRLLRRTLQGMPLLPAVLIAIAGGMGITLFSWWILGSLIHTSTKAADPIDITKLSLTIAGGVGAAVALVVAYRRQRDIEQGRFVERFGAAAAQLAASQVAVRIAGVYAMAGVADESTGSRRQQCIDVLCGYLRLPYAPQLGANHQTKHVKKHTVADSGEPDTEDHFEYLQNDKEVRQTIIRVIANHLRRGEHSWSGNDFDFRTAHLENVDFSRATFNAAARFNEATFTGYADFGEVTFGLIALFSDACFTEKAGFTGAMFAGGAWFHQTTFTGDAGFEGATFIHRAVFGEATFTGYAGFFQARFTEGASFNKATFTNGASFDDVIFGAHDDPVLPIGTMFDGADFGTGRVEFDRPRQWGPPPPRFDWDSDLSLEPRNVSPRTWPPTVQS
ncbi:pentapeptide repeat-containing protein [Nocardia sp. NPDC050710]|uniref:pentapeptide repeat-containing protein n=1 Tax=Nocardia sp. NPDC050710 TaxID=3157220 RepID=UPI0034032C72